MNIRKGAYILAGLIWIWGGALLVISVSIWIFADILEYIGTSNSDFAGDASVAVWGMFTISVLSCIAVGITFTSSLLTRENR